MIYREHFQNIMTNVSVCINALSQKSLQDM